MELKRIETNYGTHPSDNPNRIPEFPPIREWDVYPRPESS
jgi:hypothetical protein